MSNGSMIMEKKNMNKKDWKAVGYIGLILGAFFIIGGFIAYYYLQKIEGVFGYIYILYPYRSYSVPLIIMGIVPLVVGLVSLWRAEQD